MKATLEFDLPEEASEHRAALDGNDWRSVVTELDELLRTWIKHGGLNEMKTPEALQHVRTTLLQSLEDRNLRMHV